MVIARIPDSPTAADKTIHVKHQAEAAGWRNVNTGWDPNHQTYTVTGEQPKRSGR